MTDAATGSDGNEANGQVPVEDGMEGRRTVDVPNAWELQRAIERVDADRRADVARFEERRHADRVELLGYLDSLGDRLERSIRESAGVPLVTWEAKNETVSRELENLRERIEQVQRTVVGTLLTMLVGGVAVAVVQGVSL